MHDSHLRLIAEASTASNPGMHVVAGGASATAGPILACGLRYEVAEMFAFLAQCLPFAPRGLVAMLEPVALTREQLDADIILASALGKMGFLVVLYAQRPALLKVLHEDLSPLVFHRRAPNVFLHLDEGNNAFVTGWHSEDRVPMPAPIVVMGDPVTVGTHADFPALRNAGSPVVLVARSIPSKGDGVDAQKATEQEAAFWHHSACSGGVVGALVASNEGGDHARQAATLEALAGSRSGSCRIPVYQLKTGGPQIVAAALAVVLTRRSTYLLPVTDVVTGERASEPAPPPLTPTPPPAPAQAAATGGGGGGQPGVGGALRAAAGSGAETVAAPAPGSAHWGDAAAALPPAAASGRVAVPEPNELEVALYGCGRVHGTSLTQFLVRCLPGRRGLYVQALSLQWDMMLYQRPQHMATAMARQNMLVLYQQWGRASGVIAASTSVPGVFVADAALPFAKIQGAIVNVHSTMYMIDPTSPAQWRAKGNVVVYEYIDAIDEAISGDTTQRLHSLKTSALSAATMLVYSAEALRADLVGPDGSTARLAKVPNGVDVAQYASGPDAPVPPVMAPIIARGRPIVGYFGAISGWIWLELVEAVAKALPEVEFVMIGPSYAPASIPEPSELPENLHYLGPVDAKQLVLYAKHWSVGIIPFRKGEIARTTSPLKLFEYFALGLPVVVTDDMRECTQFSEVRSAGDEAAFAEQVKAAIESSKDAEFRAAMFRLAQQNSWDQRAAHSLHSLSRILQKVGSSQP